MLYFPFLMARLPLPYLITSLQFIHWQDNKEIMLLSKTRDPAQNSLPLCHTCFNFAAGVNSSYDNQDKLRYNRRFRDCRIFLLYSCRVSQFSTLPASPTHPAFTLTRALETAGNTVSASWMVGTLCHPGNLYSRSISNQGIPTFRITNRKGLSLSFGYCFTPRDTEVYYGRLVTVSWHQRTSCWFGDSNYGHCMSSPGFEPATFWSLAQRIYPLR
jgi:hypothetical protein